MSDNSQWLSVTDAGSQWCKFELHHEGLIKWLRERNYLGPKSKTFTLQQLLVSYPELNGSLTGPAEIQEGLDQLFAALSMERNRLHAKAQELRCTNKTGFLEMLYSLQLEEPIVVTIAGGITQGALLKDVRLARTFLGYAIVVYYRYVVYEGSKFVYAHGQRFIYDIGDEADFSSLPVRPMTDSDREKLGTRGTAYQEVYNNVLQRHYEGNLSRSSYLGKTSYRASGKVIIDLKSFQKLQPNYNGFYGQPTPHTNATEADLRDPQVAACCSPFVYGFSFTAKRWGEMLIDSVSPAKYRQDAFERLVLSPDRKTLIRTIVKSNGQGFSDIVDGKGDGYIVLLSGKPGVGKTLTAEAIAEELQRPLYLVSCGELGTTAAKVEARLSEIFEMAASWNALVLLDECDIFLQRRTKRDIKRNTLVAVFLRLLEYFPGILFLTTNRAKNLDPAFDSRITIRLRYHKLDRKTRQEIWRQLASAHSFKALDFKALSRHKLNGREIKHCLKLAALMAQQQERPANMQDVELVVKLRLSFG